jgi:imidazolonepropionase-like amidohydrolase
VALLRLNGRRLDQMILTDNAALKLSLGEEALRRDREPTSRPGAAHLLREILADAKSETAIELLERRRLALVHASRLADILRAIELKESAGLHAALVHADDAHEALERLRNARLPVIVGPLTVDSTRERLEAPGRLAAAGIAIAFGTDAPRVAESDLRVMAALAVKHGLDRAKALRAMTLEAAEILGVAQQLGSIESGKDADLVVYDGDPLALTSSIELVMVEGRIVHRKPKK